MGNNKELLWKRLLEEEEIGIETEIEEEIDIIMIGTDIDIEINIDQEKLVQKTLMFVIIVENMATGLMNVMHQKKKSKYYIKLI